MDYILIEGLKVMASVGVHKWEKALLQPLLIDLKLGCHLEASAQSDALTDTLDYAKVADFVRDRVEKSRFNLLESLAAQVADGIIEAFAGKKLSIEQVKICIKKTRILPGTERVGVQLTRDSARS